jgi:hypothetical protein
LTACEAESLTRRDMAQTISKGTRALTRVCYKRVQPFQRVGIAFAQRAKAKTGLLNLAVVSGTSGDQTLYNRRAFANGKFRAVELTYPSARWSPS